MICTRLFLNSGSQQQQFMYLFIYLNNIYNSLFFVIISLFPSFSLLGASELNMSTSIARTLVLNVRFLSNAAHDVILVRMNDALSEHRKASPHLLLLSSGTLVETRENLAESDGRSD